MKESLTDIILKKWRQGLLLLAIIFVINSVVPGTWMFRKQDIRYIRIVKETYTRLQTGEPVFSNEEVIMLSDKESIDHFASIWSNQLLVLPPNLSGISGFSVDENTENYWIFVSYDQDITLINVFDNYGSPIRIDDRNLWFSLFRSRDRIYREIKALFEQYK